MSHRLEDIAIHACAAAALPSGTNVEIRALMMDAGNTLHAAVLTGSDIDPELKRSLSMAELSSVLVSCP